MNVWPIALLGGAALYLLRQSQGSRRLVQGQSYVAVLELPSIGVTVDQLAAVMPDGSGIQLDGRRAVITFTAVRTAEMTDIPTPVGLIRVVSVRRVSDVVGAIDQAAMKAAFGPSWYVFSGWYPRADGKGLQWSGWTKPMVMTFGQAMGYSVNTQWKSLRAYRWDGRSWVPS